MNSPRPHDRRPQPRCALCFTGFPAPPPLLCRRFSVRGDCKEQRKTTTNANLRTQLRRIIERAGLKPWPKLFQNLRSTRETELAEEHPLHVVCAWIGNSQPIAAKHYLQVTEDHFAKAVQNPVQHPAASGRTDSQEEPEGDAEPAFCGPVRNDAASCKYRKQQDLPPRGLEPLSPG